MSRSLPSNHPLSSHPVRRLLALPGMRSIVYLWPPLLLALLTLLTLVGVYTVRPTVQVDLGEYYDSAYLRGFHAREIDASGPGQAWDWPADSIAITLPGKRKGDWIATVQAHPNLPDRPMSRVALNINGQPASIPRSSSHQFTAFIPAALAAADQLTLQLRGTPSGTPDPNPATIARVVLEPARTYRWTGAESNIRFPGLGRGNWQLDLDVITAHPNGQPLNAWVLINRERLAMLPEYPELRHISLLVPATMMRSGNMEITLTADTFSDPRPLGMIVAQAAVAPVGSTPVLTILPPRDVALASLAIVLLLYANLAIILGGSYPSRTSAQTSAAPRFPPHLWLAFLIPLAVLLLGTWALTMHRFPTSFMLPGLAGLAIWSLILLMILRLLLRGASASSPIPIPSSVPSRRFLFLAAPLPFISTLLLIFFASYWIKAAGMLYPYFIGIDVNWHMDRVRWILDGQLPLLYGTNSPLNESTMPAAEWGQNRPVIPYSPYFHMFATLFALFPWPLEFTSNMVSALVDCSRIPLVALLARRAGLSERAALLAAALLAILPVNFLLHSWGNIPTSFGLWWAFAVTAWIIVAWDRLHTRKNLLVLTICLVAALLFYTVAGLFTGLFLTCFTLALWAAARHGSRDRTLLRGLRPLWLATAAALTMVLLIYYGQYIPVMLERTLPYFTQALTRSREETGRVSDTLTMYLLRHTRLAYYGLAGPLLLTAIYLVWTWVQRFREPVVTDQASPTQSGPVLLWAAVAGWFAVMLLFVPLGYKVSMVDKHFFVAMPLLVVASAAVLDWLWQRSRAMQFITVLFYLYLALSAISLWITRITVVRQG